MRAVQKYREGIKDKDDKDGGTDSPSSANAAADSATGAASAAAGMASSGGSPASVVEAAMANEQLTPLATGPRLLACLGDPETAQVVRDFAAAQRWRNAAIVEGGIVAAHGQLQQQAAPNLLIVDVDDAEDPAKALYALADLCPPEMSVIAHRQAQRSQSLSRPDRARGHRLPAQADHGADAGARAAARQARA